MQWPNNQPSSHFLFHKHLIPKHPEIIQYAPAVNPYVRVVDQTIPLTNVSRNY